MNTNELKHLLNAVYNKALADKERIVSTDLTSAIKTRASEVVQDTISSAMTHTRDIPITTLADGIKSAINERLALKSMYDTLVSAFLELLDWTNIRNKPTSYTPSEHKHSYTDVLDIPKPKWNEITGKPNAYNPVKHNIIEHAIPNAAPKDVLMVSNTKNLMFAPITTSDVQGLEDTLDKMSEKTVQYVTNVIQGGGTSINSGDEFPLSPSEGDYFYNTTLKQLCRYTSGEWLYLTNLMLTTVYDSTSDGKIDLSAGGTGVDLSASGGTGYVLAQDASHVISARALTTSDLPTGTLKTSAALDSTLRAVQDKDGTSSALSLSTVGIGVSSTPTTTSNTLDISQVANPSSGSQTFYGINAAAQSNSGNTQAITSLRGAVITGYHYGSGTLSGCTGTYIVTGSRGTGTITNAVGINTNVYMDSSGVATNAYGCYIVAPSRGGSSTATIGTYYGIRIAEPTASWITTKYPLYVDGGEAYFGGVVNTASEYRVDGTKVVGNRATGWSAATGTATRTSFATSTVTTAQLAERVKALIDDLISHGLIGA